MGVNWKNPFGNETLIESIEKELPHQNFAILVVTLVAVIVWVVYLTYYNARTLGLILTLVLNHFVKSYGHIKIGKLQTCLSVMCGRLRQVNSLNVNPSILYDGILLLC